MKTLVIVIVSILATLGLVGGIAGPMIAKRGLGARRRGDDRRPRRARRRGGRWSSWSACPGEVQPEPQLKVPISARVSARIVELPFKEWDTVTKGDPKANPPVPPSVLVRLDAKDLEATLRSVQARYAAQEAQVVVTKSRIESQRSQIDADRGVAEGRDARPAAAEGAAGWTKDVSQSIVDTAQTKVDELTARLAGARHDLRGRRAGAGRAEAPARRRRGRDRAGAGGREQHGHHQPDRRRRHAAADEGGRAGDRRRREQLADEHHGGRRPVADGDDGPRRRDERGGAEGRPAGDGADAGVPRRGVRGRRSSPSPPRSPTCRAG